MGNFRMIIFQLWQIVRFRNEFRRLVIMLSKNSPDAFDFHTHHYRCGHAVGTIQHYVEAAINQALDMIGISDHSPYFNSLEDQLYPKISISKSEFAAYGRKFYMLKKYIKIR